MEKNEVWGVVVAAGNGSRFGAPKHSLLFHGVPLWQAARDRLLEGGVAEVVVVGDVPSGISGGYRRQDSVANGLAAIPSSADLILVHDAARPNVSADLVRSVIGRLEAGGVDGVVPGLALTDTVKQVDGAAVARTLDRTTLFAVQTPQGFTADALRSAHASVVVDVTDDAQMVELNHGTVVIVAGEPGNTKVTFRGDLERIEAASS